jgi:peptide/nickel transport system permease protein
MTSLSPGLPPGLSPGLRPSLAVAALYAVVCCAGFLAPYDPAAQHRDRPLAPPTALHFVDANGRVHLRPFVYGVTPAVTGEDYTEDRSRTYPLRFLVRSNDPSVEARSSLHLLGVDAPAGIFLAGTDQFGRDQFSRILHGGRVSLGAGLLAGALSLTLGTTLGALAGFAGGWLDAAVMQASDMFLALPWFYLLLALRATLPLNVGAFRALAIVVVVIGIAGWARPARLVRGVVLSARTRDFVTAARASGGSEAYVLRSHVLPQALGVALTQASILIPQYTLAEISLSFLGLGVAEPIPSWGTLMSAMLQQELTSANWWMAAPAVVLVMVFLLYHAFADALHARTVRFAAGAV